MYNSNNIAEKIKALSELKGVSVKKLLIDTGLGKNTMSNFKTSMPKADNLAKIADYLNCSVDYLLGRNISDNQSLLCYSDNDELNSIINNLLNTNISDGDLKVIKAILDKYN